MRERTNWKCLVSKNVELSCEIKYFLFCSCRNTFLEIMIPVKSRERSDQKIDNGQFELWLHLTWGISRIQTNFGCAMSISFLFFKSRFRCNTCGEYIYKGKKFNSRQEVAKNETYLGLKIFRFYIKCPKCVSEITFKVKSKNSFYLLITWCIHNSNCSKSLTYSILDGPSKCGLCTWGWRNEKLRSFANSWAYGAEGSCRTRSRAWE